MIWEHFRELRVPFTPRSNYKRRYSVTADILSFQRCSRQYGAYAIRKYEPALTLQLFYGTIIHQVLDRAHAHYRGLMDPNTKGIIPIDKDIEKYFNEVENSLRARHIRAVDKVRNQALQVLIRFNRLEGPELYKRIKNTECKLQADQTEYILHGNVDVLATIDGSEDEIEIWDYKGTDLPSKQDPLYKKYIFQMQVYAELYKRNTGITPKRAILYFLNELSGPIEPQKRPVNAALEVEIDNKTVDEAMDDFNKTVSQIEQSRSSNIWAKPTQAPPTKTCNECDFRWNCEAAVDFGLNYPLLYP